jgi:hypothetical protein
VARAETTSPDERKPTPGKKSEVSMENTRKAEPGRITVDTGDEKLMGEIRKKMLADSLLFLGLLKQMEPRLVEEKKVVERIAMVKIIRGNTPILDSFIDGSKVIHQPYLNETFTVLEEGDDHYRIGLPGKREGWVRKTEVQPFHETSSRPVVKFAGLGKAEATRFLAQLSEVYNRTIAGKRVADGIVSGYDQGQIRMTRLYADYEKIQKYYRLAGQLHKKYRIDESLAYAGTRLAFLARLKLWGEVLLGVEKTGTQYAGENDRETVGGGKHSISLGGSYRVNENLDFALDFASQKEVMLEVFSQTRVDGNVRYTGVEGLALGLNAGINSYSSPENERSDFSNFTLGTDLSYGLSSNAQLTFRYGMQNYAYTNDSPNDHLTHRFLAGLTSAISQTWGVTCDFLFESQSGDLANHSFTHFNPVLTLTTRSNTGFFKTRLLLDSLSFSDLTQSNYMKLAGDINWGSGRSDLLLGGFIKSYAENELADYSRIMMRFASNSKDYKKRFAVSLFMNFFTNDKDKNYSDLNLEMSTLGRAVTSSLNLLVKFWHSPGDADLGQTVSPHVIDLYWKLGFNMKYLVFGPLVGVHGNLVLSGDDDLIERDGNLLRLGGFADLDIPVSNRLRILGQASFELGNVFTSNYTGFNDLSGEILIDGVYLRHPTTLHVNGSAQYQLNSSIHAFARGGFYLVKTAFEPIPGMYPVDSNSRFYLLGGVTFRLN